MRGEPYTLLISRNLPPLVGGMERLMLHAAEGLSERGPLTVVGPSGCKAFLPGNCRVIQVHPHPALFLPLALLRSLLIVWKRRPDIVIGGSGLIGPVLLVLKWLSGVRTAAFLHGLDIIADNAVYQRIFVPSLRGLDLAIANSSNTAGLAIDKGIPPERIAVLHPGTELPILDRSNAAKAFRSKTGIDAPRLLLFVGRMTPRKGLLKFIEHCLADVVDSEPGTCLVVVGEHPARSVAARSPELRAAQQLLEKLRLESSVRFLGHVDDAMLMTAYAAADALVFPLVDIPGDVEGFGMVAIEAAACGTPTVAFSLGGVVDAVEPGISGQLVEAGNYRAFADALLMALRGELSDPQRCRNFAERFAWPHFHAGLARILADHQHG